MIQAVGNSSYSALSVQATGRTQGHPRGQPPSAQEMISRLDTNGDGSLDKSELQAMIDEMTQRAQQSGQTARSGPTADELLQKLDTDGDGKVSAAELEAGRPKGPPPGPPPDQASDQQSSQTVTAESNSQFLAYLLDNGEANNRDISAFSITA